MGAAFRAHAGEYPGHTQIPSPAADRDPLTWAIRPVRVVPALHHGDTVQPVPSRQHPPAMPPVVVADLGRWMFRFLLHGEYTAQRQETCSYPRVVYPVYRRRSSIAVTRRSSVVSTPCISTLAWYLRVDSLWSGRWALITFTPDRVQR